MAFLGRENPNQGGNSVRPQTALLDHMVGEACAYVRGSQGLKAHAAFPWLASQLPDHQAGRENMCRCRIVLASAAFFITAVCAAQGQENQYHFAVSASASPFPIVRGTTDIPDGTWLFIDFKKPWLPDAQQRIARGLPACGSDCVPAETGANHLLGATVGVQNGGFTAGPFSFKGQPIPPGLYPIEIKLSFDLKTATPEQIRSSGAIVYQSNIEVEPRSGSVSRPDHTAEEANSAPCEAIADKQNRTACFHNAGIPVVDCQHPQSADDLHFCHDSGAGEPPRPLASAAMPSQAAPPRIGV